MKESAGTGYRGDIGVGLLGEAMEGGLDLGVGARLSYPKNLIGALPRELVICGRGGARRLAAPHESGKGRLASAAATEQDAPEFHRAERRHCVTAGVAAPVECDGVTW